MGKGYEVHRVFPLTSLQIGDLQSYLSDLSLFLAFESKKLYILVDNRPWLTDLGARPAHLWQFMVTKSRMSPFANSKARKGKKKGKDTSSKFDSSKSNDYHRWFSLIDAATSSQKRALLPVMKLRKSLLLSSNLHGTLYGFIVFEVSWTDVRGINYLNELQTDTSLAIEAKSMQRWEFDSIDQAAGCISSWFSGSRSEKLYLKEFLDSAGEVFYDTKECFSKSIPVDDEENAEDDSPHHRSSSFAVYPASIGNSASIPLTPPPPDSPYKRRKLSKPIGIGAEFQFCSDLTHDKVENLAKEPSYTSDYEDAQEPTQYKDVLLSFKFDDPDLPFKLRQIIMSDLRLLTLLEAGLPSWVIFLQSYPVFCHLYRPWMCPLARALYVIMSFVTVLIGFYDLYKNVPVLKATAYRFCGPLLDWIETWEMISRIKYLGTMLFLHNSKKAVKWFLKLWHAFRSIFSFITQPLAEPLLEVLGFLSPMCNECIEVLESISSVIWIVVESSCSLVGDLVQALFSPVWFILSISWSIATSVLYPIFCIIWEILYAPIRVVLALSNFIAIICANVYELYQDIWQYACSILKLASASEATVSSYEVSVWRSLWNDLFSKVFRAVRSILNGFVAFFAACNRHRLSIYNHILDFIQRLFGKALQPKHDTHRRPAKHGTHRRPAHGYRYLLEGKKSM